MNGVNEVLTEIGFAQRRDNYRVQTLLDGIIFVQKQGAKAQKQELRCICTDISGGGAAIHVKEDCFGSGDNFILALPIGSGGAVENLVCEVCWQGDSGSVMHKVHMGVKFHFADRQQQNNLMKYILQRQQQLIRSSRDD